MANDLWRWADPNGQQRTVRLDELRASLASGVIAPNTPVWKPGWSGWQSAHEVPELSNSALAAANGVVLNIPPPPLAMVAVQKDYERAAPTSFSPPAMPTEEPPPPPTYIPAPVAQGGGTGPNPAQSGGVALPTTIGLPPPPELVALGKKELLGQPSPSRDPMIEELSGSALLDEDRSGDIDRLNGAMPPPTDPILHDTSLPATEENDALPDGLRAKNPLETLVYDLREIRAGRPPKNKPKLIVAGVLAGAVLLIVFALFISLLKAIFGGSDSDKTDKTVASASASGARDPIPPTTTTAPVASTAPTAAVTAPPPTTTSAEPTLGDCTVSAEAKGLGWRALVSGGLETMSVPGVGVSVAFASSARDGIAIVVDPATLSTGASARGRALGGEIHRVAPVLAGGKLGVAVDADRKGDKLALRRTVAVNPPIDLGVTEGQLVWAPHGKDSWAKLQSIDGDAPVEALRGVPLAGGKGIAFAFRRSGAIWIGTAKGDATLTADGDVKRVAGLGQVGSPAIAVSGDSIVVAWADRASADANWQVRWTTLASGGTPAEPKTFALPAGGLGGNAMSPSVAGLGAGRFLLAWTEGQPSNHQVRAINVGADGAPTGTPLTVSPDGMNAGQPSVGVGPDGRGVVSFLSSKGKVYDVQAAGISCPAK